MKSKEPVHRSDEEILSYTNVPVAVAADAIGWSSPTLYLALQDSRIPFGFAVQNPKTGTWTYNISPAGLIQYRNGTMQTFGMTALKQMWVDTAEMIVNAKLQSMGKLMWAVGSVVDSP